MAERTLILVRHGQFFNHPEHRAFGRLTPLGRRQARRLGKRLRDYPVTRLMSSTAPRAVDTATIIAELLDDMPFRRSPLLLEGIPTVFEGITRAQRARVPTHRARMEKAFDRFFRGTRGANKCDVLVCHGNLIRYLLRRAIGDAPHRWLSAAVMNCGLSNVLIKSDGTKRILALNDVGHLPRKMQTFF